MVENGCQYYKLIQNTTQTMFMIISSCFNLITNELPLNTTSLIVVKWYTIQIHYTKTDHHVRWCSFNGEHQHVDHIIHMTRVQPFGFLCSEAMSVHARLVKQTQVFRVCNIAYTRCMWTLSLSHPIITRCFETTNFTTVHTRGEHFIILILMWGIIL